MNVSYIQPINLPFNSQCLFVCNQTTLITSCRVILLPCDSTRQFFFVARSSDWFVVGCFKIVPINLINRLRYRHLLAPTFCSCHTPPSPPVPAMSHAETPQAASASSLPEGITDPNYKPLPGRLGNLSVPQQHALDKFKKELVDEGTFVPERMDDAALLR